MVGSSGTFAINRTLRRLIDPYLGRDYEGEESNIIKVRSQKQNLLVINTYII